MAGFTKLFSSIVTSSIWSEDDKTRIMWITMLAIADANGHVDGAIPGLADMARMSVADAEMAIGKLEAPDKYSRTADSEGRRIEKESGGWKILNYMAYRDKCQSQGGSRAADMRRYRQRKKHANDVTNDVTDVTRYTEAEAEAEAKKEKNPLSPPTGDAKAAKGISFDYSTGQFTGIESAAVAWREAYPHVDVMLEVRKAAAWLMANPDRRKTRMSRFLVNWLARSEGDSSHGKSTRNRDYNSQRSNIGCVIET